MPDEQDKAGDLPAENSEAISEESLEPEDPLEPDVLPPKKVFGRPFQKGKSGNPGGRPKRGPATDALALIADKRTPEEYLQKLPPSIAKIIGKKPTMMQVAMFRAYIMAIQGNIGAMRFIVERLEGKIPAEVSQADTGKLDELMEVLALGGVPPGEVNE